MISFVLIVSQETFQRIRGCRGAGGSTEGVQKGLILKRVFQNAQKNFFQNSMLMH